ncbi:uncharacterized protein LOC122853481 [Aphidius gifuensis]|uniref:uncharacterized protein LOC122853481 n=1 Tax=Aphidius gifuensis TaxID=684658 RepID=UPI001CDD3F5B|nr:uncharacterized protein LOC122853481 [Aphidius gifuensis]
MNWNMSMTNDHNSCVTTSQMSSQSTWSSHTRPSTVTAFDQHQHQHNQNVVNKKLDILLKVMQETLAENNFIEKEIINLLKFLEIDTQSLSYETNTGLEKAGVVLKNKNIIDFDETSLVVTMENDKCQEIIKTRNDRALKKIYEELCIKYSKIQDKVTKVQEKVQYICDIIDNERDFGGGGGGDNKNSEYQYSEIIQNQTKLNDYKRIIDNLEKELIDMSIDNDGPDAILKKYKYCMGASGELAELTKSLNYYQNLPPDIRQAKAVVEQTEIKRQQVKYLLDKKMGK